MTIKKVKCIRNYQVSNKKTQLFLDGCFFLVIFSFIIRYKQYHHSSHHQGLPILVAVYVGIVGS